METFEIDGVTYKEKPKSNRNFSKSFSPKIIYIMMMAQMVIPEYYGAGKRKEMPKVNIIEEYGLIKQKKSNLSRREREWVIKTFEENFIIIPKSI